MTLFINYIFAGLFGFFWGWGICLDGLWGPNLATVIGCGFTVFFFFRLRNVFNESAIPLKDLLAVTFIFHFAFLVGISLFDSSHQMLWVTDSHNLHLPGAERLLDWFRAGEEIERTSIYDRTYLAHILVALSFALFGVTQFASGLALILPKLVGTAFIYLSGKSVKDKKVGITAGLLFTFLPTAVFYTLTYYKEATVQMYVAILLFLAIQLHKKFSWMGLFGYILVLALAGLERHYLVPCFVVGISLLFFLDRSKPSWFRLIPFPLGLLCYLAYMYKYDDMAMVTVLESFYQYRDYYNSYADVDPINLSIPYPVALIKLYLTPIFTPRKIEMFTGFATLITWGSFLYQGVAVTALFGAWKTWTQENRPRLVALLWTPFIILLLVFAFVAPYNGRLRDSFLPVLVLFSAMGLIAIFKKQRFD